MNNKVKSGATFDLLSWSVVKKNNRSCKEAGEHEHPHISTGDTFWHLQHYLTAVSPGAAPQHQAKGSAGAETTCVPEVGFRMN